MMFHNHRKKRQVHCMYFSMYSVIRSFISYIFITFLVTHTMAHEINDFNWKLELNTRFEAFNQNNDPFEIQTNGSERNVHNYECSELGNRNSEANEENLFDDLDTLSQDDIVRKQYALLPYPAVSRQDIEGLRRHYNGNNRHVPFVVAPHNELDVVNHFVYKGRNDFMYVKYIYNIELFMLFYTTLLFHCIA